jgi:hypothetical protein
VLLLLLYSKSSAVSWDSNRIDVFVRGSDGNIWWIFYDRNTDTWSKWQSIGKPDGTSTGGGVTPTLLKKTRI